VYQSLISVLVVTPATLLVIYLFKLSRYYPANKNKPLFDKRRKTSRDFRIPFFDTWLDKEKKRNIELERKIIQKGYPEMKGFTLPNQCIYLAWFLLVSATLVSAFYVVLYSMEWGKQKSEEWVTMLLLSIFQSIFCVDPVKILLMAVVFAMLFRKMSSPSTLITRSHVIKYFSTSSRKKCDATRMTASNFNRTQLKETQVKNSEDKKSLNNLYDCISTTVLIWILLSISYSSRDSRSYELYQYIENTFVKPSGMVSFSKIQTSTDFYTWLNKTAIMKSFPETNIDSGNTPLHWRERQHIEGGHLFRVGPPRLRQLRIRK
ncbi:polycystin-1-like protein 3, partial [Ruditapes philippinarum]|uniref:polycystin-1-like protein 3 n=1 Tax=Ruditapes philippinarum TaxID=129788 RepID=UPI00295B91DF